MSASDEDILRVYDGTASLVADLGIRGRISIEEMGFLLNLLELVLIKREHPGFVNMLRQWNPGHGDKEIDEIIKATLLNVDFTNALSIQENQDMIGELINEKHKDGVR